MENWKHVQKWRENVKSFLYKKTEEALINNARPISGIPLYFLFTASTVNETHLFVRGIAAVRCQTLTFVGMLARPFHKKWTRPGVKNKRHLLSFVARPNLNCDHMHTITVILHRNTILAVVSRIVFLTTLKCYRDYYRDSRERNFTSERTHHRIFWFYPILLPQSSDWLKIIIMY